MAGFNDQVIEMRNKVLNGNPYRQAISALNDRVNNYKDNNTLKIKKEKADEEFIK